MVDKSGISLSLQKRNDEPDFAFQIYLPYWRAGEREIDCRMCVSCEIFVIFAQLARVALIIVLLTLETLQWRERE